MHLVKRLNIEQGNKTEARLFDCFKDIFDDTLVRSKGKFSLFDFYGDDVVIELKSRNNNKDTYPTTMIGINKLPHFDPPIRNNLLFHIQFFQSGL